MGCMPGGRPWDCHSRCACKTGVFLRSGAHAEARGTLTSTFLSLVSRQPLVLSLGEVMEVLTRL